MWSTFHSILIAKHHVADRIGICRYKVTVGLRWLNIEPSIDRFWDCDGSTSNTQWSSMGLRWLNIEPYIDRYWDCDGSTSNHTLIVIGTAMVQHRTIHWSFLGLRWLNIEPYIDRYLDCDGSTSNHTLIVGTAMAQHRTIHWSLLGLRWFNIESYNDRFWDCDGSTSNHTLIVIGTTMVQHRTIHWSFLGLRWLNIEPYIDRYWDCDGSTSKLTLIKNFNTFICWLNIWNVVFGGSGTCILYSDGRRRRVGTGWGWGENTKIVCGLPGFQANIWTHHLSYELHTVTCHLLSCSAVILRTVPAGCCRCFWANPVTSALRFMLTKKFPSRVCWIFANVAVDSVEFCYSILVITGFTSNILITYMVCNLCPWDCSEEKHFYLYRISHLFFRDSQHLDP